MIVDTLVNASRYGSLHPLFPAAFAAVASPAAESWPEGRTELQGEALVAMTMRKMGTPPEQATLEVHRRFIDIQVVLRGRESMGCRPLSRCLRPRGTFDEGKDFLLFDDRPESWVTLEGGEFAIFFPQDAHAPLVGSGEIHKVVLKVLVQP